MRRRENGARNSYAHGKRGDAEKNVGKKDPGFSRKAVCEGIALLGLAAVAAGCGSGSGKRKVLDGSLQKDGESAETIKAEDGGATQGAEAGATEAGVVPETAVQGESGKEAGAGPDAAPGIDSESKDANPFDAGPDGASPVDTTTDTYQPDGLSPFDVTPVTKDGSDEPIQATDAEVDTSPPSCAAAPEQYSQNIVAENEPFTIGGYAFEYHGMDSPTSALISIGCQGFPFMGLSWPQSFNIMQTYVYDVPSDGKEITVLVLNAIDNETLSRLNVRIIVRKK